MAPWLSRFNPLIGGEGSETRDVQIKQVTALVKFQSPNRRGRV